MAITRQFYIHSNSSFAFRVDNTDFPLVLVVSTSLCDTFISRWSSVLFRDLPHTAQYISNTSVYEEESSVHANTI